MSTAVIPEPIAQLQHQLNEFRSTQPGRRKLPESLWQAAVELAREHGVYSVAHPLRLDYMGLKKRLGVFRSRSGTAIRLLCYDGQGYWLAQKRLSCGKFVWWPEGSEPAKALEAYEVHLLMAAGDVSRVRAAPMWRRVSVLK
jgi:hypothetical protein